MKKNTNYLVAVLYSANSTFLMALFLLFFLNSANAQALKENSGANSKFSQNRLLNDAQIVNYGNVLDRDAVTYSGSQNTAKIERHRFWLNATNTSGLFSQILIGYMTGATSGVDSGIDGLYFNDGSIAFSSLINNVEYAIQGRAIPFNINDVVPLGFKVVTSGTYTIAIDHFDGLFSLGQAIYLKDKLTNTIQNLSTGSYTFSSNAGTFNSRFEIQYLNSTARTSALVYNPSVVYNQNQEIEVNSGDTLMKEVKVFDMSGRLLVAQRNINSYETILQSGKRDGILFIQITYNDGQIMTKKVIR